MHVGSISTPVRSGSVLPRPRFGNDLTNTSTNGWASPLGQILEYELMVRTLNHLQQVADSHAVSPGAVLSMMLDIQRLKEEQFQPLYQEIKARHQTALPENQPAPQRKIGKALKKVRKTRPAPSPQPPQYNEHLFVRESDLSTYIAQNVQDAHRHKALKNIYDVLYVLQKAELIDLVWVVKRDYRSEKMNDDFFNTLPDAKPGDFYALKDAYPHLRLKCLDFGSFGFGNQRPPALEASWVMTKHGKMLCQQVIDLFNKPDEPHQIATG